ncbi:MAG TPA: tryptophan synthase subunit alpha [Candidatus Microbacterium pullistercoris]|nr:tryptophan synthase subunit alpha [Candidatus Microbacterium pullistercoris]
MSTPDPLLPRRASVEVLRAEAIDELSTLQHERLRAGEDPWDFMEELPTVDELVVLSLRAEHIEADGGLMPTHARNQRLLRIIAAQYPELAPAVDGMLGAWNTHRRWDAVVRVIGD